MMTVFSLERVSTPLLAVGKASVAACEFFTVIDAPLPNKGHLKEPDVSATEDIVLNKVTFAYPSRPHVKILDDLDLRLEAGKLTAIVGPSGSGKSTIVGLIERWYTLRDQYVIAKAIEQERGKKKKKKKDEDDEDDTPTDPNAEDTGPAVELSGSVETCGHNLDEIDLKWWRSQIGLVQQEPFLFNDTIYKNVANGLVGSQWEDESEERKRELVKAACAEAFADEFIDKLPEVSARCVEVVAITTNVCSAIRYSCRRQRCQAFWRTTSKNRHRSLHCSEAKDSYSRRGNQCHRCPWRANCSGRPGQSSQGSHHHHHRSSSVDNQEGRPHYCLEEGKGGGDWDSREPHCHGRRLQWAR